MFTLRSLDDFIISFPRLYSLMTKSNMLQHQYIPIVIDAVKKDTQKGIVCGTTTKSTDTMKKILPSRIGRLALWSLEC